MRNTKNPRQKNLKGVEPWRDYISERKKEKLDESWAGVFREYITPNLPVEKLAQYYSDDMGRPTKELTTLEGALVLQQIFDLTDKETCDQLAFNQQWHYALGCFNQEDQMVCPKTLWTGRQHLVDSGAAENIFNSSTDELAETFDVDTRLQRIDSVHVESNMARLGRVRLLSRVAEKFLRNLKRQHKDAYNNIDEELRGRYDDKDNDDYFGDVKPSNSKKRLQDIADDLFLLREQFSDDEEITGMYSYKELERVFSEHCEVDDDEEIIVIPAKEVSSDSLQNPSDPDATYDGHKGQGYQVQLMETYTHDDKEEKDVNLITYVDVETANADDSEALKPALEDVDKRDIKPDKALADTKYGSEQNVKMGEEMGVTLFSPTPGRKPDKTLAGFEFDKDTFEVKSCPNGKKPDEIKHNKKNTMTAIWGCEKCDECPMRDDCITENRDECRALYYKPKEVDLYYRRKYEDSDEFKDEYRYRAGIEGTNSRLINMTGARRLRYRRLKNMKFAEILKALGINLFRATRYIKNTVLNEEKTLKRCPV